MYRIAATQQIAKMKGCIPGFIPLITAAKNNLIFGNARNYSNHIILNMVEKNGKILYRSLDKVISEVEAINKAVEIRNMLNDIITTLKNNKNNFYSDLSEKLKEYPELFTKEKEISSWVIKYIAIHFKDNLLFGGKDEYIENIMSKCELVPTDNKFKNYEKIDFFVKNELKLDPFVGYKVIDSVMNKKGYWNEQYWVYAPGVKAGKFDEFYKEGIIAIDYSEVENPEKYSSKEELDEVLKSHYNDDLSHKNTAQCIWDFIHNVHIGDTIYAKKGVSEIIAVGVIMSEYKYDNNRSNYKNIRLVDWQCVGKWSYPGQAPTKTLTNITKNKEVIEKLKEEIEKNDNKITSSNVVYDRTKFLDEIFIEKDKYDYIVSLLKRKKNIIIQGSPGVGKSYMAKKLAFSMMEKEDDDKIEYVQFHQSYSYEDFIMGYRPNGTGFELKEGVFYKFCKKASNDKDNDYFFIIDEINRGNLNKIFGELFLLIEQDKRETTKIKLLYEDEMFSIPSNLYIIGLMNTADRSLAMMDFALRRRFGFVTLEPALNNSKFINYVRTKNNEKLLRLVNKVVELNEEITEDSALGKGFVIGHSYFCSKNKTVSDDEVKQIVEFELIPLIEEYWFDDQEKVNEWIGKLRGAIK